MEPLYQDARQIIEDARKNAVRSVDFNRVLMYWNLGHRIFEEEQQGKKRADYGTYLTKELSRRLVPEYGSGFSIRQFLSHLSNCEHTAFAIKLESISNAYSD